MHSLQKYDLVNMHCIELDIQFNDKFIDKVDDGKYYEVASADKLIKELAKLIDEACEIPFGLNYDALDGAHNAECAKGILVRKQELLEGVIYKDDERITRLKANNAKLADLCEEILMNTCDCFHSIDKQLDQINKLKEVE
jgi:hypothetical protein